MTISKLQRQPRRQNTICEMHRRIYQKTLELDDTPTRQELVGLLVMAYEMGTKLVERLEYYKEKYGS
jgi:hypothetical protein